MRCRIKRFDAESIKPGRIILIVGKRGTGKSTLLFDLLRKCASNIDFPLAFTPTSESADLFKQSLPPGTVFDRYVPYKVDLMVSLAKACHSEGKGRKFALILDDCMFDKKILKGVSMRQIHMNGRHFNLMFVNAVQYVMDYPPDLRSQIDYVFCLKESIMANRIKLWKYFFGMFTTFEDFEACMSRCTAGYEAMVLDNTAQSVSIQDCVSWYKAESSNEPFRLGKPIYFKLGSALSVEEEGRRTGLTEKCVPDPPREEDGRGKKSRIVIDKEDEDEDR